MQFAKIDAGLAAALSEPSVSPDAYAVSVRTARKLTPDEQAKFQKLGGVGVDSGLPVLSAEVSRDTLAELTKQPWVRLVSLARRLNPS